MASKRRLRRNACEGKLAFSTQKECLAHRHSVLIGKKITEDSKQGLNTYKCHFCKRWHIGHRKRPVRFGRAFKDAEPR